MNYMTATGGLEAGPIERLDSDGQLVVSAMAALVVYGHPEGERTTCRALEFGKAPRMICKVTTGRAVGYESIGHRRGGLHRIVLASTLSQCGHDVVGWPPGSIGTGCCMTMPSWCGFRVSAKTFAGSGPRTCRALKP